MASLFPMPKSSNDRRLLSFGKREYLIMYGNESKLPRNPAKNQHYLEPSDDLTASKADLFIN